MANKRNFPGKVEELFFIVEFVLQSFDRDVDDFVKYSSMFEGDTQGIVREKLTKCKNVVFSSSVAKQLKAATERLKSTMTGIRKPLNIVEGYLRLAENKLDISIKDMGLSEVRKKINNGNVEGVIISLHNFIESIERNMGVLEEVGMSDDRVRDLRTIVNKLNQINLEQNELIGQRNSLTAENLKMFNDLWSSIQPTIKTGVALYRGTDPIKLKDYTITQLVKRMNNEKKKKQNGE